MLGNCMRLRNWRDQTAHLVDLFHDVNSFDIRAGRKSVGCDARLFATQMLSWSELSIREWVGDDFLS